MIGNNWDIVLAAEFAAPYYAELSAFLDREYAEKTVYPPRELIFTAFRLTPPERVRAVILGQDPYINAGQAHGLALSVPPGQKVPPSLRNMYKERESDLGIPVSSNGCLTRWAEQGVLLLNTVLTVEAGRSNSHAGRRWAVSHPGCEWDASHSGGWEKFTDAVLRYLGGLPQPIAFLLWGKPAQKKEALIASPSALIIKSPHPSPLSARTGFFGSRPYSRVNTFLREHGLEEIDWRT